jgi:hypothetical protein
MRIDKSWWEFQISLAFDCQTLIDFHTLSSTLSWFKSCWYEFLLVWPVVSSPQVSSIITQRLFSFDWGMAVAKLNVNCRFWTLINSRIRLTRASLVNHRIGMNTDFNTKKACAQIWFANIYLIYIIDFTFDPAGPWGPLAPESPSAP